VILLDTTVLSALMRDVPDPAIVRWLNAETPSQIWTTAVTVYEIRFGLGRLPEGRKRRSLEAAFEALLRDDLPGRIAVLDRAAGDAAGSLAGDRAARGRTVDVRDTLIAGIAIARRATIATRNLDHFGDLDVPVVNPWDS
jgi:predicted nucleic acid-binding protein